MATTSSAITKRRPFRCHRPSPSSRSKRNRSMRKPPHRARGPHFPVLDQILQYDIEPGYVVFTLPAPKDRQSVVWGTRVSVRVDLGGRRNINKKTNNTSHKTHE